MIMVLHFIGVPPEEVWMVAFKHIELSRANVNKSLPRKIGKRRKRGKKEYKRNDKGSRTYNYKSLRSIFWGTHDAKQNRG